MAVLYAADLIHGITNLTFITVKHFAFSVGLHGLTGSREITDSLNKLDNTMSYELICEIEAAQTDIARKVLRESTVLPQR